MSDLFQTVVHPSDTATATIESDFLSVTGKSAQVQKHIKWVGTQRKTEYVSDLVRLRDHSSVAVRRLVAETLPLVAEKAIIPQLSDWMGQEADRKTWLLIQTAIDKIERGRDEIKQDSAVLTVSEAVTYVKKMVSQKTFIIEGELTEVRLFQRSYQDLYFLGLKDLQDARIDCMLLSRVAHRAGFPINDGMMVRVKGKFRLGKQSRLYFDIQHIELTGEGELLRNLHILEEKLQKEGLFDQSRKREIPAIPQRILLLASPNSAAIKDFVNVLNHRRSGVEIFHYPIKTQGVGAEFEILSALKKTNQLCQRHAIDTVVMTRGGGSNDDLFVFNSEHIVRAIFAISAPTIVAIGHERDTTLAELAADLRASTPSQAAEKSSLSSAEIIAQAQDYVYQSQAQFRTRKSQYEGVGEQLWLNCQHVMVQRIHAARATYATLNTQMIRLIQNARIEITSIIHGATQTVLRTMLTQRSQIQSLDQYAHHLHAKVTHHQFETQSTVMSLHSYTSHNLQECRTGFQQTMGGIELKDPQHVLEQGYAMVLQNNTVVQSAAEFDATTQTTLRFVDGETVV